MNKALILALVLTLMAGCCQLNDEQLDKRREGIAEAVWTAIEHGATEDEVLHYLQFNRRNKHLNDAEYKILRMFLEKHFSFQKKVLY